MQHTSFEVPVLQPAQFRKQSHSPILLAVINSPNVCTRSTSDTLYFSRSSSTIAICVNNAADNSQQVSNSLVIYYRDSPNPVPIPSAASNIAPTQQVLRKKSQSKTFFRPNPSQQALM